MIVLIKVLTSQQTNTPSALKRDTPQISPQSKEEISNKPAAHKLPKKFKTKK